jgi:preprotein translocase subunit SecB
MIPLSALQLKSHVFPLVNLRANATGTHEGKINLDQHLVCVPVPDQPNHWQLEITLNQKSVDPQKPFFYDLDIHVAGIVEWIGEDLPADKKEQLVQVNGLGVLYGAAREMVLNLTSRSVFGPFCLPALNFIEALKHAKPLRQLPVANESK